MQGIPAVYGLKDGKVLASGEPREIVHPAMLHRIFDLNIPVTEMGGRPIAHFYLRS